MNHVNENHIMAKRSFHLARERARKLRERRGERWVFGRRNLEQPPCVEIHLDLSILLNGPAWQLASS